MKKESLFALDEEGDNFVLRTASGQAISLSADEVLALGQSALAYKQRIMSRLRPEALYSTPVAQINVAWDALGEAVLMEMRLQTNGNLIFSVDSHNLRSMIDTLEKMLVERPSLGHNLQ